MLALYDDPFLGGAVADFVDLALGAGGPATASTAWGPIADRLERRGFDIDGVVDLGELEVADARSAALRLGDAGPLDAPAGKRRHISIRIRVAGDRASLRWPARSPPSSAADWSGLVSAPERLVVVRRRGEAPALCALRGVTWRVGAEVAEVLPEALPTELSRAAGCARLRGIVVVDGHPRGRPTAEVALWWLGRPAAQFAQ